MSYKLRIAGIVEESITDGPGIRMVVFAQGCKHKCKGCHNPQTHSFDGGTLIEIDELIREIKKNPLLDGVTLSGGDPFEQAEVFSEFAARVRALGLNVVTYTGYTYENLLSISKERPGFASLLKNTDILVDGPFISEKKNLLLKFRGSENQRIIDVRQSLRDQQIELACM